MTKHKTNTKKMTLWIMVGFLSVAVLSAGIGAVYYKDHPPIASFQSGGCRAGVKRHSLIMGGGITYTYAAIKDHFDTIDFIEAQKDAARVGIAIGCTIGYNHELYYY